MKAIYQSSERLALLRLMALISHPDVARITAKTPIIWVKIWLLVCIEAQRPLRQEAAIQIWVCE